MLAVLAEINCLESLNKLGVYPDKFYTSFEAFKNDVISFRDATIIVIFAGSCHFSKRVTINLVKGLMKRASSKIDKGITHAYVFSDVTLLGLYGYYKYHDNLHRVDVMKGWSAVKTDVDPWPKLRSAPKECQKVFSRFDMGDAEEARASFKERKNKALSKGGDDLYVDLIKIPELHFA